MKRLICITLCLFSLSLFACKGSTATTLRVNEVTHSVFYAPLYVAIEKGFFADEGIEIELTNGGGADKTMAALLSGSADVAFCGPEAGIYVINEGKSDKPTVFGQLTQRDGSFLVGRTPQPDFEWGSLEGKTVIAGRTGGVPAMTFEYVVNAHGLYNGKNVTLDNSVQFNLMAPAFEGGKGDYVTLFEPTASELERAGKGYVVASVGEEGGDIPYTVFMALASYISQNRHILVKFTRAVQRAIAFTKEQPCEVVAEVIAPQFPSTDEQSLAASVKSYLEIDAWTDDLIMTGDGLERLQDIMCAAGELDGRVTLAELCDNTLAISATEGVD